MKHIAIIKQNIEGVEINSISAKDLHKYLEVKKDFSDWIKTQLELDKRTQSTFKEDVDYLKNPLKVGKQIDYILTLETAKHIAMMSKVKKGQEVRQYFIDVEKEYNKELIKSLSDQQHKTLALFNTQEVMGEVITDHDKRLKNLENNSRLEAWQEKNLQDAKNRKVYELANGNDKLASKLHRNVWREFKKVFHLPRYNEIRVGRYEDGLMWLNSVQLHEVV